MKTIYASEHGVIRDSDCTAALTELLNSLTGNEEETTLVFDNGTYIINSDALPDRELHITNTIGDNEYKQGEKPHLHKVGLHLDKIKSLTLDGNGCTFVMDGRMTNAAITDCENITLKDLTFKAAQPNLHSLKVVKVSAFTAEFELMSNSKYERCGDKFFFYGHDWRLGFFDNRNTAFWILRTKPNEPDTTFRSRHPFRGALNIKETAHNRFKASYLSTSDFTEGEVFHVYDTRRLEAGIFASRSRNTVVENVAQRFNYSLAFVAQSCHDITLRSLDFSTEKDSKIKIASLADFVQICMCSGTATVEDCRFIGAGDDVLNIHGIHYELESVEGTRAVLKYCHSQSCGFNPLDKGHTLRFVDADTLTETGTAQIIESSLVDAYHIEVCCSDDLTKYKNNVAEDATLNPDLIFRNNYMSNIPTRGLLITTRGRVLVENNCFHSNYMSSIDIADDAKNWYESGMVRDVTVRNNRFESSYDRHLYIHPENTAYKGAVHKGIKFENNLCTVGKSVCFELKCADDIVIKNNEYSKKTDRLIKTDRCNNISTDF